MYMEDSVDKSGVVETLENSQPLCAQPGSEDKAGVTGGGDGKVGSVERLGLKRGHAFWLEGGWSGISNARKRRRTRKEASLSSFEPISETSRMLVGNGLDSRNLNSSVSEQNGFMSDQDVAKRVMGPVEGNTNRLNGSLDLSHSLDDDNEIVIRRRPRGSSRRKKAANDYISETLKRPHSKKFVTLSFSVKKDNEAVQNGVSNGKPKKKKVICEIRDREEISNDVDALVQNKKKDNDLIQNGGNLVSKVVRRRRRKRFLSVHEKQSQDSFASDSKVSNDIQGEDEENLEENAARMLSSRFDPSCTSYCSKNSESTSYSAYGASFSPPFRKRAESRLRSNKGAGRSLRPRSRHKLKGLTRIRRHFYELNASNFNPSMAVNRKIKVFWPLDQNWYFGLVKNYDPLTKMHHIKYDDRDEEWISLQKERFKLLLLPGEKSDYGGEFGKDDKPKNKHGHNCSSGFMDSEPIISWLARSNHQGKSSSVSISGKQILSDLVMSEGSRGAQNELSGVRLCRKNKINLSGGSMVSDEPTVGQTTERTDVSYSENSTLPRVYYRRRFHKERKEFRRLEQISSSYKSNEYNVCNGSVGLLDELNSGPDISIEAKLNDSRLEIFIEEKPVDAGLEISTEEKPTLSKHDALGWTGDSFASLRLSVPPLNSGQVVLKFSDLLTQVLGVYNGDRSFIPCSILLLLSHGPVVPLWPKIHLEMLFVDSVKGLRFFIFEGCLWKAVAVVCLILSVFCDLSVSRKFSSINLPVTSIRFKLSDFHVPGRQFVFLFYKYSQLNNLDWMCLDNILRQQCIFMKELPLSKCTYSNVKSLHLVKDQCFISSLSREEGSSEVSLRHLQPGCADRICSSHCCSEDGRPSASVRPVSVPALLLNLHLKLLMENNALNSRNCNAAAYDSSLFEETPAIKENSKVEIDFPIVSIGDDSWIKSSPIDSEVCATQTSVGQESPGKTARYSSLVSTSQFTESWSAVYNRQLSSEKNDSPSPPFFLSGNSPPSTSHDQVDEMHLDQKLHREPSATDSACSMHTSNSTGSRSMWHGCGRNLGSSIENQHKNISNDRTEFMYDSFSNGSRKPRTQVSYSLPFCAYDVGSKSRSVQRRGRPYKRIESDTQSRASEESSQRCLDASICDANVLVTVSDRCWRESGAKVMLEFLDRKEWWLLVKYSGVTRYSHKASQFLQPGIVNRLTHAMMWKGGKDWMLEFTDRSQWNRFKEIHDECYNRNLRAASVKNIPIPGVRMIEDIDDNIVEVPFVRSSPKYYRQVGTEVDSALDPSRLVYDMDSDDEEWIKSINTGNNKIIGISVILFEKVMDMLEKAAYRRQCSDFKVDELELLMFGVAPVDVVKVIYDHWHQKRARKGMPLIRQLQPALWKLYQAQLEEWELASSKLAGSNNLNEKVLSRPQMFAFCLRPRGLELPNKFSKQRSQKKFSVGGQYNAFLRGHDHQHVNGRRLNGFSNGEGKGFGLQSSHGSDSSAWSHSSRFYPRSTSGSGLPSNSSESGKFIHSKYKQAKLKKMGYFNQRSSGSENGKAGLSEWVEMKQYSTDNFPRQGPSQIGGLDYDVLRLREASSAAQRSANMARLKREKAQRMLHRAEVALHKAVAAMMTAEAIKTSEEVNRISEDEFFRVNFKASMNVFRSTGLKAAMNAS